MTRCGRPDVTCWLLDDFLWVAPLNAWEVETPHSSRMIRPEEASLLTAVLFW